jgi:hypothetical protein
MLEQEPVSPFCLLSELDRQTALDNETESSRACEGSRIHYLDPRTGDRPSPFHPNSSELGKSTGDVFFALRDEFVAVAFELGGGAGSGWEGHCVLA